MQRIKRSNEGNRGFNDLFAGLRLAEIKALDWKGVDLAGGVYPRWGENLKAACAPARANPREPSSFASQLHEVNEVVSQKTSLVWLKRARKRSERPPQPWFVIVHKHPHRQIRKEGKASCGMRQPAPSIETIPVSFEGQNEILPGHQAALD
ncbi:MAG TPA: hypothetical protein VIS96_01245 [Terrimicrobiaceae bacterium]